MKKASVSSTPQPSFSLNAFQTAENRASRAITTLYSKIPELTELHKTFKSAEQQVRDGCIYPTSAPESKPLESILPENLKLKELVDIVYKQTIQMMELYGSIKIWVQLMMPSHGKAKVFQAGALTDIAAQLDQCEDGIYETDDAINAYRSSRIDIVNNIVAFPTIEDYKTRLYQYDLHMHFTMCLSIRAMRDDIAECLDFLAKNKHLLVDHIQSPVPGVDEEVTLKDIMHMDEDTFLSMF